MKTAFLRWNFKITFKREKWKGESDETKILLWMKWNEEVLSIKTVNILTDMESLKLPTTPGDSPGVGFRKQGLLALQRIPWSHGSVPADGIALLGKWPAHGKQRVKQSINISDRFCRKTRTLTRVHDDTHVVRVHLKMLRTFHFIFLLRWNKASICWHV